MPERSADCAVAQPCHTGTPRCGADVVKTARLEAACLSLAQGGRRRRRRQTLLALNPAPGVIEGFRWALLAQVIPYWLRSPALSQMSSFW
jgi:hypothetical protein